MPVSFRRFARNLFFAIICAGPSISFAQETTASESAKALQLEVNKMMETLGWPRMIEMALARGDMQRTAIAHIGGPLSQQAKCVEQGYVKARVLERIAVGYMKTYDDPKIVADITKFIGASGGQKILGKLVDRSKAVGVTNALEEKKSNAYQSLTPSEKQIFTEFSESPAGKVNISVRPAQLKIHKEELTKLADQIVKECS
jgi:hypothetical protein